MIEWDANGIVASRTSVCMTNKFLINFADQTISATDAPKTLDDKTKKACAFVAADKSQLSVFVLKGTERWDKEHWKGALPEKQKVGRHVQ